jgi:hypothetical protein
VAQEAANKIRTEKRDQLNIEHAKPVGIPHTRGAVLMKMLYAKRAKDRNELEKQLILAEFEAALSCLMDAEIEDAMSRLCDEIARTHPISQGRSFTALRF